MDKSDKIFYGIFAIMVGFILMCVMCLVYVEFNSEYINKP